MNFHGHQTSDLRASALALKEHIKQMRGSGVPASTIKVVREQLTELTNEISERDRVEAEWTEHEKPIKARINDFVLCFRAGQLVEMIGMNWLIMNVADECDTSNELTYRFSMQHSGDSRQEIEITLRTRT